MLKECQYLHEWDTNNQLLVSEENTKQYLSDQVRYAVDVIRHNFEFIHRAAPAHQQTPS